MTFIFDWLPSFIFQILLIIGVLGSVLSLFLDQLTLIPVTFRIPFRILSAIFLGIGLIFMGYNSSNEKWLSKVHEGELKIAKLETQAEKITIKEVTKYIDRIKVIKEKGETVVKEIPIYITKNTDDRCTLTLGVLRAHDSAAGEVPRSSTTTDGQGTSTESGRK